MTLRIQLLGSLRLYYEQNALTPQDRVERELLALTALRPSEFVSADHLASRIWADAAPARSRGRLRRAADEVRALIDGYVDQGWSWSSDRDGSCYRLEMPASASDLLTMRHLAEESRRAFRSGSYARSALAARTALRLWQGQVLADLPSARSWPELPRLHEERWQLLENRIEADLACGQTGLTEELQWLVRAQPRRERPRAMLIAALRGSGRHREAGQVYLEAREALADEWGLDPGLDLQRQGDLLDGFAGGAVGAMPDSVSVLAVRIEDELAMRRTTGSPIPVDQLIRRCTASSGGDLVWSWNHHSVALFAGPDHPASAVSAALAIRDTVERIGGKRPGWLRVAVCRYHRPAAGQHGVTGLVVDGAGMRACERLLAAGRGPDPVVDQPTYAATSTTVGYRVGAGGNVHEAVGPRPRRIAGPSPQRVLEVASGYRGELIEGTRRD